MHFKIKRIECRNGFLGGGGVGSGGISKRPLEEQEMVRAWSRDLGTCRMREVGGFKTYFGINLNGKSCCRSWGH